MDKQDLLDSKTQEFCALINSLLRADILTRMQHDLVYQAAYKSNDLLSMWSALENWCAAGSTKSVQNRIQARFMKLYQHDSMSYEDYVSTFSSKLKQLETFNLTYSDSFTTELFIQGLNNKVFGPARERLILNEELQGSFIMGDTTYPSTWTIAASYFRLSVPHGTIKEQNTLDTTTALVANHDN